LFCVGFKDIWYLYSENEFLPGASGRKTYTKIGKVQIYTEKETMQKQYQDKNILTGKQHYKKESNYKENILKP